MLNFTKLHIEGFASLIDNVSITFGKNGLTLVKGLNGAGKTSIFSALAWAIYGKTLKDKSNVVTWEHVRPTNYKGVKVEIEFKTESHSVKIIRCENYNGKVEGSKGGKRLILKVDGKLFQNKEKKTIQAEIDKYIGMSHELFINSIIFGQKMKRIIEASGPNQKKVFDEAFDVNYVNLAKKNVEVDYKEVSSKQTYLLNQQELIDSKITSTRELLNNAKESEKDFENIKNERLSKLEKSRDELNHKYELTLKSKLESDNKIKVYLEELRKLDLSRLEELKTNKRSKLNNVVVLKSDIKRLESNLDDLIEEINNIPKECSKCGSKLNKQTIDNTQSLLNGKKIITKTSIKNKKVELEKVESDIAKLDKELLKLESVKTKHDTISNKCSIENNNNSNIKKQGTGLLDEVAKISKEILSIKSQKRKKLSKKYKNELKALKLKVKPIEEAIKSNRDELDILNWLVKDPLSNSGLKTYIFNSMLNTVNDQLFQYSRILGFEVEFGINMESARKEFYSLIAKDGNVIPFEDLSGGQQQLVNIAIAFAIHSVVNQNNNINILIMDELFESLDSDNIDVVTELIQLKSKTKDLYLITHQKEFNPCNSNTIQLKLQKNGTTKVL